METVIYWSGDHKDLKIDELLGLLSHNQIAHSTPMKRVKTYHELEYALILEDTATVILLDVFTPCGLWNDLRYLMANRPNLNVHEATYEFVRSSYDERVQELRMKDFTELEVRNNKVARKWKQLNND